MGLVMPADVARHLIQNQWSNPIKILPQERADKPRRSRVASQRIPESKDPDGLFIV
jgi:hypothetical protein